MALSAQTIPSPPAPSRAVNDYVNWLTDAEAGRLERKLRAYHDTTSTQIVVVLIPSLDGLSIEDYSVALAQKWGIGQRGKDNGLLILASQQERLTRIEVGYGLEGYLTDLTCNQIIEKFLIPHFRKENYYQGLDQAIDRVILRLEGSFKADQRKASSGPSLTTFILILVVFVVLVILLVVVITLYQRKEEPRTYESEFSEDFSATYGSEGFEEEIFIPKPSDTQLKILSGFLYENHYFEDPAFAAEDRAKAQAYVEAELRYFANQHQNELTPADQARLTTAERYFDKLLKDPSLLMSCDYTYVSSYIDNFMQDNSLWERYRDEFSIESIISTQAKFQTKYEKLRRDIHFSEKNILDFYLHFVRKLEHQPAFFLSYPPQKKTKPVFPVESHPSSYPASTSQDSSKDHKPKLDHPRNSDSFRSKHRRKKKTYKNSKGQPYQYGGGSFGGGGATGSW